MSSFNPNQHKLTAAEWQEIARNTNEETGAQFTVVSGVVLGLFAAAAASPVTGLLVAGYFGWKAWQDTQAANRNDEAIDSYGCVAHLLKSSELKDYVRQIGAETATAEITFAVENGYRATPAAIEFIEARGVDVDAFMLPQLPTAKDKELETESEPMDTPQIEAAIDPPVIPLATGQPEPPLNLSVNPEINVHNHIGKTGQQHRTASPAQSDRRIQPPDLTLYPDIRERMTVLLRAMAESGLPLGTLLNHPFVWCWGRSQSGKTTIALLLATARLAMGHQVSYFTTDDDYPRSLPWQRTEDTPEGYAVALDDAVEMMSKAGKGKLKGQGWVFDELFAAAAQHKIEIQPLLTCVLMKGAKCGAGSIGISQADTSTAHGLKGIDTAWREERVSIQAIHEEDAIGNRHPTGRYIVARGEDSQEWCIPEWMLSELNSEGNPDPMVWVLNRFPELNKPTAVKPIENSDRTETKEAGDTAAKGSSEPLDKLTRYLQSKQQIDFRTLEKNWGRNNDFQGEELRALVTALVDRGSVAVWGDGIIWKG